MFSAFINARLSTLPLALAEHGDIRSRYFDHISNKIVKLLCVTHTQSRRLDDSTQGNIKIAIVVGLL